MVLKKFSNFLHSFTKANQKTIASTSCIIIPQKEYNFDTATGMAEWASQGASLKDLCDRAYILGNFLIHYDDENEAKNALVIYTRKICEMTFMPRFLRRDILACVSRPMMRPDIDTECYEKVINDYDYTEAEGTAICMQIASYMLADEAKKLEMRADFDVEILQLVDCYLKKAEFYVKNQSFIKDLYQIEDKIESDEYGI